VSVFLYDDARARAFAPFALTRPIGELRAGAVVTRERWERVSGEDAAGHVVAAHLADYDEPHAPGATTDTIPAGSWLVNSRFLPSLDARPSREASVWRNGSRYAAVRLTRALAVADLADGAVSLETLGGDAASAEIRGRWVDEVWHYIRDLHGQLCEDIDILAPRDGNQLHIEPGAMVDPMASVDCTKGPVLVRKGAIVSAFTRVIGPCYIGEASTVSTDRIEGCAIGEHCKVHGELSASIVLSYANKNHDGFVGHSYLGRWVNLGAGTITSNLKNTYGSVQLWTPTGPRDTGLQFLGTLFGDFVKTGIGSRLTTGTVVGAGANVVHPGVSPKYIPPFAWDDSGRSGTYALDRFYETAERQMQRRAQTLGPKARRLLAAAHALASRDPA
jgi:UDP-N-acetylglucosamine diphosphorylase / glucose-1-phosphate thymidylyltransferase / UDP-N-acetylgalactosamine diphosphorylase / glucosamine-1-phosphate N-acetyltransferase / galactosamine-1-phosphate N-acetyltransferase